ncbi:protein MICRORCHIDIA 6-like [Carica papaya]|uniref:protein MICRORCHIDIA 6-like n=1 Tax=Carica papaya TaxID=3649 RepID=UPI000B8CBB20|nr:protein MICRORCHIDIA 6-like [Carica papaya]
MQAYLSILYLRLPESFKIILRGQVVGHHNVADDLKFPEFILYKPQTGGCIEGAVVTTIGFLKEAPQINVHGFCVYHKNRLILPFWQVVSYSDSRGRGVVGVLEANFVKPTHNKQDFERTSLFQKVEVRLKEMTWEYWDYHCGLIGYQVKKKLRPSVTRQISLHSVSQSSMQQRTSSAIVGTKVTTAALAFQHQAINSSRKLVGGKESAPGPKKRTEEGLQTKRREHINLPESGKQEGQAEKGANVVYPGQNLGMQPINATANQLKDQEAVNLMQENKKLRAKCLEYEKSREALHLKVEQLKSEIRDSQQEYDRLMTELQFLDTIKEEKNVNM